MKLFNGDKLENWFKNDLPIFFSSVAAIIFMFMLVGELSKEQGSLWLAALYLACLASVIRLSAIVMAKRYKN